MFSYYGGKSKIINHYPAPKYDLIIEPFAGSARYALKHGKGRRVWLNDKYRVIYDIWLYLQNTTKERIEELPQMKLGDDIRNYIGITEIERTLLGMCVATGRAQPAYTVTAFGDKTSYPKEDPRWRPNNQWTLTKRRILQNLDLIKNWAITCDDYRNIPNEEATWYIDPPYKFGGDLYVENQIDYKELADWCLSRKGQVIVCENSKADWLPFKPLVQLCGQKHKTLEVIYTN
jgi:site-specific DNA-adenine methylase